MNLYGYADGDPINNSDPFGLCWWDLCIAEAAAAKVMLAVGAAIVTAAYIDVTRRYGGPSKWFAKASTSGETAAAAGGRAAHKEWDAGAGFLKEYTLPSGKRCDAYNPETCEIKELKPDNPNAKKKGERQVKKYKEEAEAETGKKHTTTVETYPPKP